MPEAEPTAEPTATPTPPGFEAVFANFFASQSWAPPTSPQALKGLTLLKMLRYCRSVSDCVPRAEKEKGLRAKGKRQSAKRKNAKFWGEFFLCPFYIFLLNLRGKNGGKIKSEV